MQKLLLSALVSLSVVSIPAFAHHPAADNLDEETWEMIDSNLEDADSPHLDMEFDDMGSVTTNMRDETSVPVLYPAFEVDISEDMFVNPEVFTARTGGMEFVDENEDGIVDVAQDSASFESLQVGAFEDSNSDTIHDAFQTSDFYEWAEMDNFVDVNGDGLSDNYVNDPWAE